MISTTSARRTPLLADMKPWGRFTAVDLYNAGGTALLAKRLLDAGLLHRGQMTASLKTLDEEALSVKERPGQDVVRPLSDPIKNTGGLMILRGNLAPGGMRGEDLRPRKALPSRPGARFRSRRRRDGRRRKGTNQKGRRRHRALRRAAWRARYARNARPHGCPRGPGLGRRRGPA